MQYAKRKIDITFNLGLGSFGETKGKDVTLSGHRVSVSLALPGGAAQTNAQFRIFGLPLVMINQLTRIGTNTTEFRVNGVQISAGDEGGAMSVVHEGTILTAYADLNSAPEVAFEVISRAGVTEAMRPVAARSYKGATDAGDVMADLAKTMGVGFERNGVSVILQNPYFPGTAWTQLQACAQAAGIEYTLDRGLLAIWKRGKARDVSKVIRVAPDTGMVGYPTFNAKGIAVRTLFNPDVGLGKTIEVDTEITPAAGKWNVAAAFHTLESETPNGAWFTDVLCNRKDLTNE